MPKFLLEVYRRSLAEDGDQAAQNGGRHTRSTGDGGGDQLITALDREVIEQSDIIMTFLNKSESLSDCNFLKQHHQQPSRFIHVSLEDRLGEIRAEKRSDEGRKDGRTVERPIKDKLSATVKEKWMMMMVMIQREETTQAGDRNNNILGIPMIHFYLRCILLPPLSPSPSPTLLVSAVSNRLALSQALLQEYVIN